MKYGLFLLLIFSSISQLAAEECNVELYAKLYKSHPEKVFRANEIIKQSTCSNVDLNSLLTLISNANGTIGADFIQKELKKDVDAESQTINISPAKISIYHFEQILKEGLNTQNSFDFQNIRFLNGNESMVLNEQESLKISCDSCSSTGNKNIKIEIYNPLTGNSQVRWASTKILAKVMGFRAKHSLSFQKTNLNSNDFYRDEITTDRPEAVLSNIENIQFFKVNKNIPQGAIIQTIDVQPINVVNYGTPVSVTLQSPYISLQKMATPVRSARYGEMVELRDTNNKIIHGKAIDFNKVMIEL